MTTEKTIQTNSERERKLQELKKTKSLTEQTNLTKVRKQIDPNNITEYGMRIVMDEEKILKEDIYDLDEMYKAIDDIAIYAEMKKIDKYYYVSQNDSWVDLGCFMFSNLQKKEWFMDNVKEITWYDKIEGVSDIIKFLEERNRKKKNEKIA